MLLIVKIIKQSFLPYDQSQNLCDNLRQGYILLMLKFTIFFFLPDLNTFVYVISTGFFFYLKKSYALFEYSPQFLNILENLVNNFRLQKASPPTTYPSRSITVFITRETVQFHIRQLHLYLESIPLLDFVYVQVVHRVLTCTCRQRVQVDIYTFTK